MADKTWRELSVEMEEALVGVTDEYEIIKIKLEYNKAIGKAWEAERKAKNSAKASAEGVKAHLGKKVTVTDKNVTKLHKRVLKQDADGYYVILNHEKAYVEYDAVWDNFKITHYVI